MRHFRAWFNGDQASVIGLPPAHRCDDEAALRGYDPERSWPGLDCCGWGVFSILVLAFQDLTNRPIVLDPGNLRLRASTGARLEPRDIDLEYSIERFHPQTITPEHGTAAVAIFALPAGATPARLTYDDQTGHPLSVNLAE